jgi:urease accessory protein
MTTERLLALLQLADGLFPAGGFAHSFGLETYVQAGRVRGRDDLDAFLIAALEGAVGPGDAAAAAFTGRAASAEDLTACGHADARLEAMKSVPELRSASRQMGRQTLRAAVALSVDPLLADFAGAVEAARTPGHHAVAFGLTLGRQGVEPEAVAAAYLHSTAVLLVGAALRLLPLGQVEGQRALAALRPRLARLAARAAGAGLDDLWSWAPGLELAGLRHAELEARLFRS